MVCSFYEVRRESNETIAKLTSYDHIDLSKYNVHDVAAVLRIFFREMPEPVIPFDMYEPLLEIQRDASIPLDERIQRIKNVLVNLPPAHVPMLRYLVQFLQDVEEQSEYNKMTVSYVSPLFCLLLLTIASSRNLAIVFGPNIIKPKVETVQNALEMPLLQGIIQLLIEHSDAFWDSQKVKVKHNKEGGARERPLSVIFVGTDLTALLLNEAKEEAEMGNFHSLARSSPGCSARDAESSMDDSSSEDEDEERESSEHSESSEEKSKRSPRFFGGQKATRTTSGETQFLRSASPAKDRRASEPCSNEDIRVVFKKSNTGDEPKPTKESGHTRTLSGHHVHVPFRKKKVKRLLNLN